MATMSLKSTTARPISVSYTTTIPSHRQGVKSPTYDFTSFALRPTALYPRHYQNHRRRNQSSLNPTPPAAGPSYDITSQDHDGPSPKKRARSEPPNFGGTFDDDVSMTDLSSPSTSPDTGRRNSPLKRTQSHWDLSQVPHGAVDRFLRDEQCPPVQELSEPESQSQSQSQSQLRCVSPAPTEVDDPEPEYVADQLHSQGIKIHDYALEPRLPPVRPPILPSTRAIIPELFDQHDAIAEFEYRMTQKPRLFPMNGKTLRRLLDIRWVDTEEVRARGVEMDLVELRKCDAKPQYPFVLKYKGKDCRSRPTEKELTTLLFNKKWAFMRMDRMRRNAEAEAQRKEWEAQEVEQTMESIRRKGKGRAADVGEKRKRFDEEWEFESSQWSQSLQSSQPIRQYPAPLASYDPEIYPEAAGVIESQQLSQGRPAPPQRVDTPPLAELEQERKTEEQDGRPNALKRGLKRTLSRTQTFTQL